MPISISIHVEGYYGLMKGVPRLLNLFEEYGIKTSFFINMGREASFLDLLKYRKKGRIKKEDKKIINRYSKKQLLEMILFRRKLGCRHCKILKEIKGKGHEVNPHCWSHLIWSKNFSRMNHKSQIRKMKKSFFKCFGKYPKGFTPPTWKINDKILGTLKKEGFKYVGVKNGKKPSKKKGIVLIPLSFEKNIEELINEGLKEEEILKTYKKELKKKYVNLYFHADFEGIRGIKIFEEVLKMVDPKKVITYEKILKKSK